MTKLYLDDSRTPLEKGWDVVRNYDEFVAYIETHSMPDIISFDHDLCEDEMWRAVDGYKGLYEISSTGQVRSLKRNTTSGKMLSPAKTIDGLSVHLRDSGRDRTYTIHRLVAEAFIPNPENKKTVNHKDGNRWNNNMNNLEWATQSENIQHSHDNLPRDFQAYGENHNNSLTVSQYDKNGRLWGVYGSVNEAGRQNNIEFTNIAKCARGERATAGGYVWKYEGKEATIKSEIEYTPKTDTDYTSKFFIPNSQKTGLDCAKYIGKRLSEGGDKIPQFNIHSKNTEGSTDIKDHLLIVMLHNGEDPEVTMEDIPHKLIRNGTRKDR